MKKLKIWLIGILTMICGVCLIFGSCSMSDNEGEAKKLASPVLIANGTTVTWNQIENTSGYILTVNGAESELSKETLFYEFSSFENGIYTVTVAAKGGENYQNSDSSNSVQVIVNNASERIQLDAPVLTVSGTVASWQAVDNASGYILTVNGLDTRLGADIVSFDFSAVQDAAYVITVTAIGEGEYKNSAPSNEVSFEVLLRANTKVITVQPSTSVALSKETLALTVAEGTTLSYAVTYNDVDTVALNGNAFATEETGYYGVIVTATDGENTVSKKITLVVDGTYLYGFDELEELSGQWVLSGHKTGSNGLATDENEDKSWKFEANNYGVTLNIPVLRYDEENIAAGDLVRVSFIVRMTTDPEFGGTNNDVRLNVLEMKSTIATTKIESNEKLSEGVHKVTLSAKLYYDDGTKNNRIQGFQVYGGDWNESRTFTYEIDNIVVSQIVGIIPISVADREITVAPKAAFTLSEQTLGLTADNRATLSYAVTYNDSQAVTLTNNAFTTAENGYYAVIVTATYPDQTADSTYLLLIVEGTYVYGFNKLSALEGIWVANTAVSGTSKVVEDVNGNKAWGFEGGTTGKLNMNFPILNYDKETIAVGDDILVSFTVRVVANPEENASGTRLDQAIMQKVSPDTTIVSNEKIENGLYRVTVRTPLAKDGARLYVDGFNIEYYWNTGRTFTFTLDNIVVSKAV